MAICDRGGLPIAVHVASASPYEPHLVPTTLDARFLPDLPWCVIGDRGYGQRWTRRPVDDAVRHRDDRGESSRPREDAGRPGVATREAPLENRTALCLAPQLPPRSHPLGATRRELPGHGAARLCPDLAPGICEIASRPCLSSGGKVQRVIIRHDDVSYAAF